LRDLRSTTESARTNYVSTRPHTPSPCGCALRDQSRYAPVGGLTWALDRATDAQSEWHKWVRVSVCSMNVPFSKM
jgi:hypothetical protein